MTCGGTRTAGSLVTHEGHESQSYRISVHVQLMNVNQCGHRTVKKTRRTPETDPSASAIVRSCLSSLTRLGIGDGRSGVVVTPRET